MPKRSRSEDATINLTPMIDVVFLLVIFFMVGSKFSESESRVNVNVAGAADMQAISRLPDKRIVDVAGDGSVTLDGQMVAPDQLYQSLQEQFAVYPGLRVLVRAERNAPFDVVDQILRTIRNSGIANINLAAKGPSVASVSPQGMRR
ncbi:MULTISPECIES: ExbD/TolR family protein [Crateriforma]|uniref:Biopolymer transport protein ExbD n=1 Tax=Crateriforma conspicua TaxID=2527996 RepID=A0A5C5Y1P1_9PLAN|nr:MULTISPECIES: biopolymer transporter ExbD [Crateriforma]QDV63608.1 biopolymer transport protein ExbD [Crateriforma conspicua]TWT68898.1 biopolymer transport protein ExbD [Crateriforma conspicua]